MSKDFELDPNEFSEEADENFDVSDELEDGDMADENEDDREDGKGLPASVFTLFKVRMKRDGRYDAFTERITELTPIYGHKTRMVVMREFGFKSEAVEREAALLYERSIEEKSKTHKINATRRQSSFENAVFGLPDTAPPKIENDWIRAHPAMTRKIRSKQAIDKVILTAADVLAPPHGPAPSKSAVYALQYWCNNASEFFKLLMSEQKKQQSETVNKNSEPSSTENSKKDADIDEVEKMLREMGMSPKAN